MPIRTIEDLTEDQLTELEFRKGRRKTNHDNVLVDDTLYAVLLVRLHPNVTPSNYAALQANVEAIAGFAEVDLLFSHKTRPTERLPDGRMQVAKVSLDIELKNIPEPEPE